MKNLLPISLACLALLAPSLRAEEGKAGAKPAAETGKADPAKDESGWYTDYAEAQKVARKEKKPIVMLFTGSDWCGWCIKLEKQILGQEEFKTWAAKKVVLFKADFPRKKKLPAPLTEQNEKLGQKFGIEGYPTIIVIDSHEKTLGKTGYRDMTPKDYGKHLEEIIATKGRATKARKN